MASVAVSASAMKSAMKSAIDSIDVDSGEISNDDVLNAICTAIANEVNNHTHDVGYIGAGSGSSAQTTTSTPPGNP